MKLHIIVVAVLVILQEYSHAQGSYCHRVIFYIIMIEPLMVG